MGTIILTALVLAAALALLSFVNGRSMGHEKPRADLRLLPGDIKYESPSGNVRVYVPITTSIVLSIVLTLLMRFFG